MVSNINLKQVSSRMSVKRKADELDIRNINAHANKREFITSFSMLSLHYVFLGYFMKAANNYFMNIVHSSAIVANNASVEGFIVRKLMFMVNASRDGIQWTRSQDSFKVIVEKMAFASGVTKKAYKVRFY
jgi:hypothetical protein